MAFPLNLLLSSNDIINDRIWTYLHKSDMSAINALSENYGIRYIQKEIQSGCSPSPDIITENFGEKESVLFIGTVYGFIYQYLNKSFNREEYNWNNYIQTFFDNIIQRDVGIYGRLNKIYRLMSEQLSNEPEFGFTELVKTVLVSKNNTVSGLNTGKIFLEYFINNEYQFLKDRLNNINGKCFIFTFTDKSTFFTLLAFDEHANIYRIKGLPHNVEVYFQEDNSQQIIFNSSLNKNGKLNIDISSSSTFTDSIAFKTIFKIKDKNIFIIPLPHPSSANNGQWTIDKLQNLKKLLNEIQ